MRGLGSRRHSFGVHRETAEVCVVTSCAGAEAATSVSSALFVAARRGNPPVSTDWEFACCCSSRSLEFTPDNSPLHQRCDSCPHLFGVIGLAAGQLPNSGRRVQSLAYLSRLSFAMCESTGFRVLLRCGEFHRGRSAEQQSSVCRSTTSGVVRSALRLSQAITVG